eukprot:gene8542-8724_t
MQIFGLAHQLQQAALKTTPGDGKSRAGRGRGNQLLLGGRLEVFAAKLFPLRSRGPLTQAHTITAALTAWMKAADPLTLAAVQASTAAAVATLQGAAADGHLCLELAQHGMRQVAISQVLSPQQYLYLGLFATESAAAQAYDVAALKIRGHNSQTNFPLQQYLDDKGALPVDEHLDDTIGQLRSEAARQMLEELINDAELALEINACNSPADKMALIRQRVGPRRLAGLQDELMVLLSEELGPVKTSWAQWQIKQQQHRSPQQYWHRVSQVAAVLKECVMLQGWLLLATRLQSMAP